MKLIEGDRLPTIAAGPVRLRWLEESDVPALFDLFSEPDVTRYWSWPAYTRREQAAELLADIHRLFKQHTLYQWGIERVSEPGVVGTCTLARLDHQNQRSEIGFALGRPYWGQGLIKPALHHLIDYAFGPLGMRRLEADVDPKNTASLRRLESLGFQREGYLRERWKVADQIGDSVLLGLLAKDDRPPLEHRP